MAAFTRDGSHADSSTFRKRRLLAVLGVYRLMKQRPRVYYSELINVLFDGVRRRHAARAIGGEQDAGALTNPMLSGPNSLTQLCAGQSPLEAAAL
jgi:hypothetical protein